MAVSKSSPYMRGHNPCPKCKSLNTGCRSTQGATHYMKCKDCDYIFKAIDMETHRRLLVEHKDAAIAAALAEVAGSHKLVVIRQAAHDLAEMRLQEAVAAHEAALREQAHLTEQTREGTAKTP